MGNNVIFSHSSSSTPPPPPPAPPPEQYQSSSTRAEALQRSTVFPVVHRWQILYEYMCICIAYSSTPSPPEPLPIHPKYTIFHYSLFIHCYSLHTLHFMPKYPPNKYTFTPLLTFTPLNPTFYPYFTHILESTKICITE